MIQPFIVADSEEHALELADGRDEAVNNLFADAEAVGQEEAIKRALDKTTNPLNSIILYIRRRDLSEKEKEELQSAKEERKAKFTPEYIKEVFKDTLANVPDRYKEDVYQLLMESRLSFGTDGHDIRKGVSSYEIEAIVPKHFSVHVQPNQYQGLRAKTLARIQQSMIKNVMLEISPRDEAMKSSSHFYAIQHPGGKAITSESRLDDSEETTRFLEKNFRFVFDMSPLTKYIVCYSGNVNEIPISLSQCN